MPVGTDAWTSSTIIAIAVACALIGVASMSTQLRNYDETIATLRSALDSGPEAEAEAGPEAETTTDGLVTAGKPMPLDELDSLGADIPCEVDDAGSLRLDVLDVIAGDRA